ncbi:MAG: ABC transporter permease [Lachnospiraceae bacterium]|nr:ABC transporter permease [Lachnospiraceae bacterium]
MLNRKMLRELKKNFGQFFSLFFLAFLAVSMFACMKSSNIGAYKALDIFNEKTNRADGWLYGEGFGEEELENVRSLPEVKDAQLRMHFTAKTVDFNSAQLELFIENEDLVSKPWIAKGADFDVNDKDGIWISESFAKEWKLDIGDEFSMTYEGFKLTKKIAGLIYSPEYIYLKADKDADIYLDDICIAYMPLAGVPVEHLPFTELVITSDEKKVIELEEKLSDAVGGKYAVFLDEKAMPGIRPFLDELEQHDQFSYLFTLVFLLVALLVIMTTMGRIVKQQRTQIGTMNAMGLKRRDIAIHYLSYSFVVSAIGSVIGFFVGTYLMGEGIAAIFRKWYLLPGWKQDYDISTLSVIIVVVAVCVLSTWFAVRKLMKVAPSEALRPAPPKSGKNCIFEKLPFWNKLRFEDQYNLRDASRAKLRTFMGIFGCACGMLFMVCAFSCRITIDKVFEIQFEKIQNFQTEVDFNDDISLAEAEALREKYEGELAMSAAIELAKKPGATSSEKKSAMLSVNEGKNYSRVVDTDMNVKKLKKGEVALTMKVAKSLGLKEGDTVYWHIYTKNEWHSAKIGLINRIPTGSYLTMLREDFEETGIAFEPDVLYTNAEISEEDENGKGVLAVHTIKELRASLEEAMAAVNAMILVFILFAAVLPIVVLFNCGNLSFNERVKEFATLKVMGFQTSQIRGLLARQNMVLSLIGIVIGAPFGRILLQYMFDSNGDSYDYQVYVSATDYLLSGGLVLLISVSVSFLFDKKIKKLDMVEVLKGVE